MVTALLIKGASEGLSYLDNDISLMSQALESLNIANNEISGASHEIIGKINDAIDDLDRNHLLVYYTGHAVFRNGRIQLKVASGSKGTAYLSISTLFDTLNEVSGYNRIGVILDCCNSGAALSDWKKHTSERVELLLASSKYENAKEISSFQSSFFTHYIAKTLLEKKEDTFNGKAITFRSTFDAVLNSIHQYNEINDTPMPIPSYIGTSSSEFKLFSIDELSEIDKTEEYITAYLSGFQNCVEHCTKDCYGEFKWCDTIFKIDINMLKYLIPSIHNYVTDIGKVNTYKLDRLFDDWIAKIDEMYMIMLGEMGVGKSSSCVYLFYYLCQKYLKKETNLIPVFLPLTNLSIDNVTSDTVFNYIQKYMDQKLQINEIKNFCHQHRLVFILDGFDEISGDASNVAIVRNYNLLKPILRMRCKTLLTCRTHYFLRDGDLEDVFLGKIEGTDFSRLIVQSDDYPFDAIEILQLSEPEIIEFIHLLAPEENEIEIWKQITSIYDLQDLAKRPILLKMILTTLPNLRQINTNTDAKITASDIYSIYTNKLLQREIQNRKVGLDIQEKHRFIEYISYLMYKNDILEIDSQVFNVEIEQYFKNSIYTRGELNNCNYDCKVATFFSRDRQDKYRFIHKSFYEFYLAEYCLTKLMEDDLEVWSIRWFSQEIANFIAGLLKSVHRRHMIFKILQMSKNCQHPTIIWNLLHILSLLDSEDVNDILNENERSEFISRGYAEDNCVLIRQYCRIISKFIDRTIAEELIEKIISIVRVDEIQNIENDETYYNYYGGENAAYQAFIKHLSVKQPKYDVKLHLYLLEHLAPFSYAERIKDIVSNWENADLYAKDIEQTISCIESRQ